MNLNMEPGEVIDLLQQMVLVFNSEEIISEFGRFKPNGTTGTGGNLFVDLCTSLICSARLAAWNVGEQTLAETRSRYSNAFAKSREIIIYV